MPIRMSQMSRLRSVPIEHLSPQATVATENYWQRGVISPVGSPIIEDHVLRRAGVHGCRAW
ncbi:hypothetical protein LWC34_45280 [Kibdelosporangium philippinense]|uniref:Uncharacterized protein n=1 Tax=Kibdelosporangium philippinense TaxID=211113 RepID=A0ABS8ZRX3_9PSEU|nr:hypothetical protein [Kibdelosporangium philippinense]MCE7009973.1 hypothetical protein [Kibdelosporangium philippinense]